MRRRNRPLTTLEHMVADFQAGTTEDDLTHVDEFIALHDSARNVAGTSGPEFEASLRDNFNTRLLHHHTFTTLSLIDLLGHAGVQVLAAETRLPHDIYVLGQWSDSPENEAFAEAARRSPFGADRRALRRRV